MDQISPAMQFALDKVETRSWESSSPHAAHSPSESTNTVSLGHSSSSPSNLDHSVTYSVITDPSGSRESTAEPVSPGNLQIMQESPIVCKQEDLTNSINTCKDQSYENQAVDFRPPSVGIPAGASTSSTAAAGSKALVPDCNDLCTIPQCMRFGTYLLPEKQDKNIIISLEGAELWHQFYQVGTEMIITKSGRRMFPGIVISVGGLEPDARYNIALEFNPVDNARYKYINTKWVNIGKSEAHCEELLKYIHPESPSTGKHWMSSKISFKKIKVTNNKNHKKGLVVSLNSMHKYQPRVVISKFISKKSQNHIFTHDLVECTFIGVTAYQNDQVTQLKIDHNPFAKAFRESSSDNELYNYGMMSSWPPLSPLLSPYGAAGFTTEGQALPMLSPSCIPPAGPSPLPQFNSAFCNWESPPYSPSVSGAAYRSPFQNPGSLHSPTLLPDHHRQVLASRLVAHDSPPISPLLYQPASVTSGTGGFPANHPSSTIHVAAAHQYTTLLQQHQQQIQQQQKNLPGTGTVPEIWVPKNDYSAGGSSTSAMAGPSLAFEVAGTPVGYGCHTTLKTSVLTHQQQFTMPKVEQSRSPVPEHHMDL